MRQNFVIIGAVLALMFGAQFTAAQQPTPAPGPVLQAILDRGRVVCGVNTTLPGFIVTNESGESSGFSADWCRAIAVAVLGDASAVEFVELTAATAPTAFPEARVDVTTGLLAETFTRSATWGGVYGPNYFFDGQTVGVNASLGINSLNGLNGHTVCLAETALSLATFPAEMAKRGLMATLVVQPTIPDNFAAFAAGDCDAIASGVATLAALRLTLPDPSQMVILPDLYTLQPSGPVSSVTDPQFADIVRWVVNGVILADHVGIDSANVDSFLTSDDLAVRNLLGLDPETAPAATLGLAPDFMVTVLREVGSYSEIYERNLGPNTPLGLERGENRYWTDGGLLYAAPFR